MAVATVTAAISAQNTFTDSISLGPGEFNLSVWGTFVGTVTVQRSFDAGVTWLDVQTFTTPSEEVGRDATGALYRVGVKAGEYTSGTANVRLSQ